MRKTEGIFPFSSSVLCGTGVTNGQLRCGGTNTTSSAFSLCLYTYITVWKKRLCILDKDNKIHSEQEERGWWVRHPRQLKTRPWLCTGNSPAVLHYCHIPLHKGTSILRPPPPSSSHCLFSSTPSGSQGNRCAFRKKQFISLGLAQNIQNPFLIRVFHIKLVW